MRRLGWAVAVAACGLGLAAAPAGAATFTVDNVGDAGDANTADNLCATAGAVCTLRAAIQQANVTAGLDTINFNVPGGGTATIQLTSAMDNVSGPVTIDGYTQPGSSANTNGWFADAFSPTGSGSNAVLGVEIDLKDFAASSPRGGIVLSGAGSSIKGVAIYNAREPLSGADFPALTLRANGINVTGCLIGLRADGSAPVFADHNAGVGINVEQGDGDTIGGLSNAQRNVISGNNGSNAGGGIRIEGGDGHKIQGNLIGTRPSGLADTNDPSTDIDFTNAQLGGIEVRGFNPGTVDITNLTIG